MQESIYFGEQTWEEIASLIEQNAVAVLPVGTTEEHGSHLPVETDAIIARYFGDELGRRCRDKGIPILVLRTIYYGFSMGIVRKWPGCPNVPPRIFTDYIFSIVDSLVEMGFRKVVLLDCHGNHDCLLRTVMREIADKRNVFIMTLEPFRLCREKYDAIKKAPEGDIHGGEYETSCVMYIRPELVKTDRFTDVDKITCNSFLRGPVSTWGLQETKTGIFGDPTPSSAATGEQCLQTALEEGVKYVEAYYRHTEQSRL